MKTLIVNTEPSAPVLIIAEDENAHMSFNFKGRRADFYNLFLQLREMFEDEDDETRGTE